MFQNGKLANKAKLLRETNLNEEDGIKQFHTEWTKLNLNKN